MFPRRVAITVISFSLAILVSIYVIRTNWPAGGGLGIPPWAHLLALLTVAIELFFRATKITLSARALGVDLSLRTATRTILGGDIAASVTPGRTGAEPARFLVLAESKVPVSAIIVILFLELFLEAWSLLAIGIVLNLLFQNAGRVVHVLTATVLAYAFVILGGGGLLWLLARRYASSLTPPPALAALGMGERGWRRLHGALIHVHQGIEALKTARRAPMMVALAASIMHVAMRLVLLPIIVLSVAPQAALAPLVLWPLALYYGSSLAPVPAGGGVVEFGFQAALGRSIPQAALGTALLWWRVYSFYIYLPLGALAAGATVMRALRQADTEHTSLAGLAEDELAEDIPAG